MRKRSAFRPAVFLTGAFFLTSSLATAAVIRLTFGELARRSRLVLAGEVVDLTSYRGPFHDVGEVIFTDVKIRIDRVIKGVPGGEEITVQVLGGKIGDETMVCLESPKYELGERVLVFLRDYNGRIWNTGWLQGKYRLEGNGEIGGETVAKGQEGFPLDEDATLDAVKEWVALSGSAAAPPPGGSR